MSTVDLPVTFNLSVEDKQRLDKYVHDMGEKRSSFVRAIILEHLKKHGR